MLGDTAIAVNPNDARYKKFIGRYAIHPLNKSKLPIVADQRVDTTFGTGMYAVIYLSKQMYGICIVICKQIVCFTLGDIWSSGLAISTLLYKKCIIYTANDKQIVCFTLGDIWSSGQANLYSPV